MQLNVFDLPRDNILEVLPRFSIGAKYDEAIAQFENTINEIRLDQLPQELAGNGKSDRHTQTVFPVEIKLGDRAKTDSIDNSISGIFSDNTNIPENTLNLRKHGTIEDYLVKGKNRKTYKYQRYIYIDDKGIYRHHRELVFSQLEVDSFDIPLIVKTDRIACHAIQPSGKTTWFRAGHLTQLVDNNFGSQTSRTIVSTKAVRFEPQELAFIDDRLPYFLRFTPRPWVMSLRLKIYFPDPIRYGCS